MVANVTELEVEPALEQEIRKGQLEDEEIKELIKKSAYSIHPGSTKMYLDLKERFWWYGLKRDVAAHRVKAEHQRPAGLLQPMKIPEWKWEEVGMDFITGLPRTQKGYDSIWVIVDRLTKVAHFIPTDGQTERTNQILEDMLRACALQYGSSWDKSLCYAEFSYNNSYQQSLRMSPFEALYGRKCRTPLFWNQSGEGKVFGPEVLKQAEDLSFEIGDFVYLKVSPMRGVKRFNVKGKLAPRYIGPFKILERRGEVAYQLELPEKLAGVHDVFHVSQLKKCLRVPEEQIPLEELNVQEDLTYEEYPVKILEESERVTRNKVIQDEATWEREDDLKAEYPHLFQSTDLARFGTFCLPNGAKRARFGARMHCVQPFSSLSRAAQPPFRAAHLLFSARPSSARHRVGPAHAPSLFLPLTSGARLSSSPSSSGRERAGLLHRRRTVRRRRASTPPPSCLGLAPEFRREVRKPRSSFSLSLSPSPADPPPLAAGHHRGLNPSLDPQNRTHVVSSTFRAKRGEKLSFLAPSRANSGEVAAARRRDVGSDLSHLNRAGSREPRFKPVHGSVNGDVSPLVAEPFEFADDSVLEDQEQQQFTEEGKYNTDHPCYLYTD
nr:unnamed protein product [Digitaria exilis]